MNVNCGTKEPSRFSQADWERGGGRMSFLGGIDCLFFRESFAKNVC